MKVCDEDSFRLIAKTLNEVHINDFKLKIRDKALQLMDTFKSLRGATKAYNSSLKDRLQSEDILVRRQAAREAG